jgi:hypothetical protein
MGHHSSKPCQIWEPCLRRRSVLDNFDPKNNLSGNHTADFIILVILNVLCVVTWIHSARQVLTTRKNKKILKQRLRVLSCQEIEEGKSALATEVSVIPRTTFKDRFDIFKVVVGYPILIFALSLCAVMARKDAHASAD